MRLKLTAAILSCVAMGIWAVNSAQAQVNVDVEVGGAARPQQEQKVRYDTVLRSSSIIGMKVKNAQGQDLGKINDLVIGLGSGRIRYAALSFGGFAGLGDKLFAVPFRSLQLHYGEEDKYFVLNVPIETLKNAEGFDQDNWPDTANPQWAAGIDKHYGVERGRRQPQTEASTATDPTARPRNVQDVAYRASTIEGMDVQNAAGEDLGDIHELVIDMRRGDVRYAALSFGTTLGFGGKLFAIPWNKLTLKQQDSDRFFVLNVSEETLKNAPGFNEDNWPDTATEQWQRDIDKYYGPEQRG